MRIKTRLANCWSASTHSAGFVDIPVGKLTHDDVAAIGMHIATMPCSVRDGREDARSG